MNITERIANELYLIFIKRGPKQHGVVMSKVKEKIYDIDNKIDKIKFLQFLINKTNEDFKKHLLSCSNPQTCRNNFEYESIIYYLQQELHRLGVYLDDDTFTEEEKSIAEEKIDAILSEIKKLEIGQEIIYEDIQEEISELKSYFFIGKKTWYQIFIGKLTEMSLSGIISETVSKGFINIAKTGVKLLGF